MILVEKRIELNDKLYIDSWYDKYSRSYITQVKDMEDNEVDYIYSGSSRDRDFAIQELKDKYKEDIVEYLQPKDEKKKKKELPMTGLSPVLPDQGKGVDTFNKNASVDASSIVGEGGSE